jgi:hypothetical protein
MKISKIEKVNSDSLLYDLQTSTQNFYAEGVLVHNSLIKLFNYREEWLVSTSGMVAAASEVGNTGRSFADLFWNVFHHVGYSKDYLDPNLCFVFELCHRDNKVVVDYPEPKLPLLAVRDRTQDFEELDLEDFGIRHGYRVAQSFSLSSIEEVQSFVNSRDSDHEGVILFDGNGRVKSKSDIYCHLHRVKGNGTPDFAELFLNDDLDEFLLHFPEFSPQFLSYKERIVVMGEKAHCFLNDNNHLDQKEFALKILKEAPEVSSACFSIRSGKHHSYQSWIESLTPVQLNRLLQA